MTLEQVFRDEWGRVVASLIGLLGDFDLAEEAAQEAFAMAVERWPRDGAPASPRAWLLTTARNRAIDRIRRDRVLAAKTRLLETPAATEGDVDETTIPDERLELVFTCCHPALALGGAPARERARGADAPRAGGSGTRRADARQRRSPRRALRGRHAGAAPRPGPRAVGPREDRARSWRARARARARGPRLLRPPGLDLDRYHYLHATRAELLRRLDRVDEARVAYDRALALVASHPERRFLERRRAELS